MRARAPHTPRTVHPAPSWSPPHQQLSSNLLCGRYHRLHRVEASQACHVVLCSDNIHPLEPDKTSHTGTPPTSCASHSASPFCFTYGRIATRAGRSSGACSCAARHFPLHHSCVGEARLSRAHGAVSLSSASHTTQELSLCSQRPHSLCTLAPNGCTMGSLFGRCMVVDVTQ